MSSNDQDSPVVQSMQPNPVEAILQPTPFIFTLEPNPLVVKAFSLPFRVLATVLVLGCALWMWSLWQKGLLTPAPSAVQTASVAQGAQTTTPATAQATAQAAASSPKRGGFFGLSTNLGWMVAAMALLLYTLGSILRSRTTLDDVRIHQSWMWDKELKLTDMAYVKIIRVPGLDWLIAPRLYARTLLGKFNVFYAADARMIAQWERLQRELADFRRM